MSKMDFGGEEFDYFVGIVFDIIEKNVIVVDRDNYCFFVYSIKIGKFIRKIGCKGNVEG